MAAENILWLFIGAAVVSLITLTGALKLRGWLWHLNREVGKTRAELAEVRQEMKEIGDGVGQSVVEGSKESVNAACLAALDFEFPVFMGGWSIDGFFGRWLVEHLQSTRPKTIVELGSGTSTLIIAKTLLKLGENDIKHFSVDHEVRYLEITRKLAELNGLDDRIAFCHCPLVYYDAYDKLWYEGIRDRLGDQEIDLLIVDGPPGPLQPKSRAPALPELLELLSDRCTVVLDDAGRGEEQDIAKKWSELSEFELEFQMEGHGMAILRRGR